MRRFNTTGVCIPEKYYMVDLSERVQEIKKLVDDGKYFTINRARQYGKTTTLTALKKALSSEYEMVGLDFQGLGSASFRTEESFCRGLVGLILTDYEYKQIDLPATVVDHMTSFVSPQNDDDKLKDLMRMVRSWCAGSKKPVVMMIDEVDSATNNQVFLDFLAQLRDGYLARDTKNIKTFQSVILAGVTDVKHLRAKIRLEDEHKENSPWNIAADFDIDMSLSEDGIRGMLDDYEADHHTGMDTTALAKQIREYTSGYPFLVSRICQLIDEKLVPSDRPGDQLTRSADNECTDSLPDDFKTLSDAWTAEGVERAVKMILSEDNTLFDSIMGKLRDMTKLRSELKRILFGGESVAHSPDNDDQKLLRMYGFIINDHNKVAIANRIFEMRLYNYFIGESTFTEELRSDALDNKPDFIIDGELDVPLIMRRFIETQRYIRDLNDEEAEKRFIEEEGREKFLTYLSPIINGVGTFSVEEQTRDRKRMDVVIHYNGRRYIIELKIWRGDRYNEKGEKQIMDYLDRFGLTTGYMLSFNFNKNKKPGVEQVHIGGKVLYEGIV